MRSISLSFTYHFTAFLALYRKNIARRKTEKEKGPETNRFIATLFSKKQEPF
jgi:hypothetical protein